jgi:hypothetical protein
MWNLLIVGAWHDLARALRSLVRAPGFTLSVSLLLGLGVAATTTLFALVNAVLLKPLPYANPEQLVIHWWAVSAVLAASWLPARRAARINPASAMRI